MKIVSNSSTDVDDPIKHAPPYFALLAGEASGDAHGARLVEALQRIHPDARFVGVGGSKMRAAGVDLIYESTHWGSIGVIESVKLVGLLWRVRRNLVRRFTQDKPDLFIPIDFGFFNIRMANALHRWGVRVLYYFPPKSWDRRAGASPMLRESTDAIATPFPWSAERLNAQGCNATFVGHPLVDDLQIEPDREMIRSELNIPLTAPVIALLPGSRGHEVKYLWPVMVEAACRLSVSAPDIQFVVPVAPTIDFNAFEQKTSQLLRKCCHNMHKPVIYRLHGRTGEALRASDAAAICSGTATLEAAARQIPMLILYKGSVFMTAEWRVRKKRLSLKFIGMPNLIAGREIVRELLAEEVTTSAVEAELLDLLNNEGRIRLMKEDLGMVLKTLGSSGSSDRTASLASRMVLGTG